MQALIGTWHLTAWYTETTDGRRLYPFGTDASGYISYAADGFFFVHLMQADRALFAVTDPFGGTEAEDSAAMKSHMTYAGRFDLAEDHVVHHVTHASCPNWVGTDQIRFLTLAGDDLRLEARGVRFQNETVNATFTWRRAGA